MSKFKVLIVPDNSSDRKMQKSDNNGSLISNSTLMQWYEYHVVGTDTKEIRKTDQLFRK